MDEAVDRGGGRHGVLEDPVPLAEDEVARDQQRAALVALGEQREEDLGLLGALLDVAEVVEDQELEEIELAQEARAARGRAWPRAAPGRAGRSA